MGGLSNNRIDVRSGRVLRRHRQGEFVEETDLQEAWAILREFRRDFQVPLTKANMGLRSCVRTVTRTNLACAQRLKQPPRMIEKLCRKPTMRLSQMEDVGGCRTVLPRLDTVYKVADRLRLRGRVLYEDDANMYDRATGYRALHLITDYDGRRIEVQLRTVRQHDWAEHVEELDDALGTHLKDGDGPDELLIYLKRLSDGYTKLDRGDRLDSKWQKEYESVRAIAENYLRIVRDDSGR